VQPLDVLGCALLCFCLQRNYRTLLVCIYSTSIYIACLSSAQPLTLLACAVLCFCLQRNYRTFLMFIYSTSIYIAWTFGVSLGSLFVRHRELAAAVEPAEQDSISSNLWLQTLGA
jgi:hypothetical protein